MYPRANSPNVNPRYYHRACFVERFRVRCVYRECPTINNP